MAVIIYTNEYGNVSVCMPTGEVHIEAVLANDCPEGAIIVDESTLPNEHNDFFNAWRLNDGVVTVDLDAAKEITKARLRREREPLMQAQDIAFQRALEEGLDTTEIVAEKNRLRNITTLVDSANSPEELRAIRVEA